MIYFGRTKVVLLAALFSAISARCATAHQQAGRIGDAVGQQQFGQIGKLMKTHMLKDDKVSYDAETYTPQGQNSPASYARNLVNRSFATEPRSLQSAALWTGGSSRVVSNHEENREIDDKDVQVPWWLVGRGWSVQFFLKNATPPMIANGGSVGQQLSSLKQISSQRALLASGGVPEYMQRVPGATNVSLLQHSATTKDSSGWSYNLCTRMWWTYYRDYACCDKSTCDDVVRQKNSHDINWNFYWCCWRCWSCSRHSCHRWTPVYRRRWTGCSYSWYASWVQSGSGDYVTAQSRERPYR